MTGAEFSGVDIDLLADYVGGALEGTPDESVVAARIAEDPAWRAAYESLRDGMALVGAELGRLPAEPMPAELAGRLDEMLRTTPHLSIVSGDAPAAPSGAHAVPAGNRDRTGRRMRWATPIAIAAGIVAFVGFSLDYLAGRDQGADDSAPTAAGSGVTERSTSAEQVFTSGTDYTRTTLAIAPPQPLVAPGMAASSAAKQDDRSRTSVSEPALSRLTERAALADCFAEIERENAGGTIAVESIDYARFDGAPALVVRFTAGNGAWAWAAGPQCGTPEAGAATLDKVPVR